MAWSTAAVPPLDGYQLRLPIFEGPLDVLLRLIEREQLAISEVSLLAVLDQFIAYAQSLDAPSPEAIAEFAAVAGRLSLLKSRALLPRPPKPVEDPDESDLVRQLEEYRAVKAAAQLLANRQHAGSGAFVRGDAVAHPEQGPLRSTPQPPTALSSAMSRWLARLPSKPEMLSARRVVSLQDMASRILMALQVARHVTFRSMCATCESKHDVAGAFLAMLTLFRGQAIDVRQDGHFGEIVLMLVEQPRSKKPDATLQ